MAGSNEKIDVLEGVKLWSASNTFEIDDRFQSALADLVRRRIGETLKLGAMWEPLDPEQVAEALTSELSAGLDAKKVTELHKVLTSLASQILVDEEPQEVTRLLWMWNQAERGTARATEQALFSAIETELRKRLNRILLMQRFSSVRRKVDQGDLVSELYLKLERSNISRLPENRRQFYALADRAVSNILLDMQKAAMHRPRTQEGDAVLDFRPDPRTAANQLQALLKAESEAAYLAKRLRLDELLAELPADDQEIVKLRRNGATIEEVVAITGFSRATVVRRYGKALAFLSASLEA